MRASRRTFLETLIAAPAALAASKPRFKIGVTDWNLRQAGKLEALALAKKIGFAGVEISIGRKPQGDSLPLADTALQQRYVAASKEAGIALAGTCLDILHVNYLKNDKLGQKWVADGIAITKSLKTKVMLLPFFGKGALATQEEKDYVGDALRELAPQAAKAGIVLALENTISAEDNVRIMERTRSTAVKVFYDTGNSFRAGFDPVKEIRWLGKERIAQIHLKDNPGYIGEGKIDFAAVMKAIAEIRYEGFADLETDSPSKSVEADMARNLAAVRKLLV
jgi:sugar phosphate isomerase/epimerase